MTNFALAFGVAFLLWRDMENGADKEGDEGDGRMGDWFLCLMVRGTRTTDDVFDTSDDASVDGGVGLSAAAVNVHNVLACVGALTTEEGGGLYDCICQ